MKPQIITISIPSDASNFVIHNNLGDVSLVFSSKIQDPLDFGGDIIRFETIRRNYKILGKFSDLKDQDLLPYVEGNNGGNDDTMWFDYIYDNHAFAPFQCDSPRKSILSLHLKSNGLSFCQFDKNSLDKLKFLQDFLVITY